MTTKTCYIHDIMVANHDNQAMYPDNYYQINCNYGPHTKPFLLQLSREQTAKLLDKAKTRLHDNIIGHSALTGSQYLSLAGSRRPLANHNQAILNPVFKYGPSFICDSQKLSNANYEPTAFLASIHPNNNYIRHQDSLHHVDNQQIKFAHHFLQSYDVAADVMQEHYQPQHWQNINPQLSSYTVKDPFEDKAQNDINFAKFGADSPFSEIAINDSLTTTPVHRYHQVKPQTKIARSSQSTPKSSSLLSDLSQVIKHNQGPQKSSQQNRPLGPTNGPTL